MSIANAAQSSTQEAVVHHSANAAAIAIPTGAAYALGVRDLFVYIPAVLGMVWYSILIAEKVASWLDKRRNKAEEIDTSAGAPEPHKKV